METAYAAFEILAVIGGLTFFFYFGKHIGRQEERIARTERQVDPETGEAPDAVS